MYNYNKYYNKIIINNSSSIYSIEYRDTLKSQYNKKSETIIICVVIIIGFMYLHLLFFKSLDDLISFSYVKRCPFIL